MFTRIRRFLNDHIITSLVLFFVLCGVSFAKLTSHTESLIDSLLLALDSDADGAFSDESWYTSLGGKEDADSAIMKTDEEETLTEPHTIERERKKVHTSEPMFTGDYYDFGGSYDTVLYDPDANGGKGWTYGALVGRYVYNTSDGCTKVITGNTTTTVTTAAMASNWDSLDTYQIVDVNLWDGLNVDNDGWDPSNVTQEGPYKCYLTAYGDPLGDGNTYVADRSKAGDAFFSALATKEVVIDVSSNYDLKATDFGKTIFISKTNVGTIEIAIPDCESDPDYIGGILKFISKDVDPQVDLTFDGAHSDTSDAFWLPGAASSMTAGNKLTLGQYAGNVVTIECLEEDIYYVHNMVSAADVAIDAGAGSSCVPETTTADFPMYQVVDDRGQTLGDDAYGQEIVLTGAGNWTLSQIKLHFGSVTTADATATVRIGSGTDLTSAPTMMEEWNITLTGEDEWYTCDSVDNDSYTDGTTYYIGFIRTSGTIKLRYQNSDVYAGGDTRTASAGNVWAMGAADGTRDYGIEVIQCQ